MSDLSPSVHPAKRARTEPDDEVVTTTTTVPGGLSCTGDRGCGKQLVLSGSDDRKCLSDVGETKESGHSMSISEGKKNTVSVAYANSRQYDNSVPNKPTNSVHQTGYQGVVTIEDPIGDCDNSGDVREKIEGLTVSVIDTGNLNADCDMTADVKNVYDLDDEDIDSPLQLQSLRKLRVDNKENVVSTSSQKTMCGNHDHESRTTSVLKQEEVTHGPVNDNLTSRGVSIPAGVSIPTGVSGKGTKRQRNVSYIYSKELVQQCDLMQKIPQRASIVHSLIEAYGLLKYMRVVPPSIASEESLGLFHSADYITFLKKINNEEDEEKYDEEAAQFGLTYDCPGHLGVFDYSLSVGGATITAAETLVQGESDVVINWCGGWHHAQKDSASGFCYVNDIVLGILKLREKFSRVLYVDLDLHHGDGVQNAFYATSTVMTVSIHKYAAGFFPGSGRIDDVGVGRGKHYSINIPLQDGARDQEFVALFCRVMQRVREVFSPEAVVCQCGADGLAGDPMDSFNLTHLALGRCVYFLMDWALPTLLLGGGGYHHTNTARCWAYITGLAVGKKLPTDIPDHQFFTEYGPDFEIDVLPGNRKDQNSREYLRKVHQTVMGLLSSK